ncbi:hypothetical protein ABMA27_012489 [Loxostege sticticalis]|uniref:Uncharacterized protein n=1 Tax=Loxostege sticticalis TaxID=481309 RepID=A0ABR3H1J0_LOXSC
MRSALVTFLIVLYHAAQLPCRSVTRGAPPYPPSPSSQEDLEAIIARNREITELLLPLLEANLGAQKLNQNKRNELLKVFPYRNKEPVVEFLPFTKSKSRDRNTPLALILASELTSRKGKKGSKVHAQKAFLIHNDKTSTEEDYDAEINQEPAANKNYEEKNTIEDIEYNKSIEMEVDENKRTAEINDFSSDESDQDKNTEEVNDSEESYDIDIRRKAQEKSKVKKKYLTKETQEESSEEIDEKVLKENNRQLNRGYLNLLLVKNNSGEYDDIQSSEKSADVENNYHRKLEKDDRFDSQSAEKSEYHMTSSERSHENYVDSKEDNNEPKHEIKQNDHSSDIENFTVSRELVVVDVSKEHDEPTKNSEFHQNNGRDKTSSEEKYKNKSDEKYKSKEENDVSENFGSAIKYDEGNNSKQPSDGSISNISDENKTSKDQDEKQIKNEDYDHITNENDVSDPDQYVKDYLNVSDYHENVEHKSREELYDEDVEKNTKEENDKVSYEDVRDEENDYFTDVEGDNRSEENYGGKDTEYVETENDLKVSTFDETSEDDTLTVDNDSYIDSSIDNSANDYISVVSRKASNEDDSKNQATFSQEIADKYAEDSKYTVEDDHFLVKSSGELAKFNAHSVEGLIEVLQQDDVHKCEEEDIEIKPGEMHLDDHPYEVNKSYKLSFKFNK